MEVTSTSTKSTTLHIGKVAPYGLQFWRRTTATVTSMGMGMGVGVGNFPLSHFWMKIKVRVHFVRQQL
jgi:hypothetical protein